MEGGAEMQWSYGGGICRKAVKWFVFLGILKRVPKKNPTSIYGPRGKAIFILVFGLKEQKNTLIKILRKWCSYKKGYFWCVFPILTRHVIVRPKFLPSPHVKKIDCNFLCMLNRMTA